ncbi:MAG TPA: winged helix-turn-helix domain-containing protein [Candidatus Eisenbergiella merdavium]|uniref:Winged helix-turn-helix domain-containing protein n=1 Tax=Candidatus Eisenbergiella merdavium TaxID=2838551 RepID=A0A9D2NGY5_9FIRM|nr:winged helix-turn-helix domain-containing protein [Candidatus Eisenbergiella merdavium]
MTEKKILKAIEEDPCITQSQIAADIGITMEGIRYAVKGLKTKGILKCKF